MPRCMTRSGNCMARNAFNDLRQGVRKVRPFAHYLGASSRASIWTGTSRKSRRPRIKMYHSVGAADPLTKADMQHPIGDGLPETLAEWIPYNGVLAIKIKLNGNDLAWDVDRVAGIDRVTAAGAEPRAA